MAGSLDDPVLGNSALDRLANTSFQIVILGLQLPRTAVSAPGSAWPQGGECLPTHNLNLSTRHPSGPMAAAMAGVKTVAIGRLSS